MKEEVTEGGTAAPGAPVANMGAPNMGPIGGNRMGNMNAPLSAMGERIDEMRDEA